MELIDIVGNVRINESNPERIKYLIACIRSFYFLRHHCVFVLNLEGASDELMEQAKKELEPFAHRLFNYSGPSYGDTYMDLLSECDSPFVLNFFEDHFSVCNSTDEIRGLLRCMEEYKVDICKTSFWQIERTSLLNVWGTTSAAFETAASAIVIGNVFTMDENNYTAYCRAYGERFFLGVNFLTTRSFAQRFWNRSLGPTPHTYELAKYDKEWEHTVIIPAFEICAAIDDCHGENNSHLLARNEQKFLDIYNTIEL